MTISLFGPLRVQAGGETLSRFRTRSVAYLLALLALRQGRAVSRAYLAGVLWPDSDEAQALQNLRHDLVVLRKSLGAESVRIQSPTRDTLRLDVTGADVDVLRFDAAIKSGDEAALQTAVEIYAAPLLEDCQEEWAFPERESRKQACLQALETLAQKQKERGNPAEAIRYLRRAEALDPLRDSAVRRLMVSLAEAGDFAAAVEAYRNFRDRLHDAMAVAPDAETTLLFQKIRDRARDMARVAALPTASAPPRLTVPGAALSRTSARPPHALGPLIGREQEVEEIWERLTQSRLVTLVGTGGVGKTRLTMEVATRAETAFDGGAVWVELAPLTEDALILPAIATALGIRQESGGDAEALQGQIVARLSEAVSLLALDNCEHLIDATAAIVQTLLSRCPELRVLAASRQRLGLAGEIAWRVPSLPVPDTAPLPADHAAATATALTFPAVRLFVERAAAAQRGFQLTRREDVEAVCLICRRLDGIPLALELAAARANILPVEKIASRLDDRFRLLIGNSRAYSPRHRTLRTLIDWSYDQLPEPERILLRRLSVFAGGWSLEAAEAIFDTEDALEAMASLADKSLILAEAQMDGLRYRILETVREYGREKLQESGEEAAVRARHAEYFLALAEQARPFAEKTDPLWLDRLEREHDNLRAALTYYAAQEETHEGAIDKAARMAVALALFWISRGHIHERRTWHLALSLRSAPPTAARAHLLAFAGWLFAEDEDRPQAKRLFAESLTISRQIGDKRQAAAALNGLADMEDNPEAARAFSAESLAFTRELGDRTAMARSLYHMGRISRQLGDYDAARAHLREAYALDAEMGVKGGFVLRELGDLEAERGDYASGRRFFERFVAERQEIGDPWGVVWGLEGMGGLELAEGRTERAARILGASDALREFIGRPAPPHQRAPYDRLRSVLQEAAGEPRLTAAWEEGRAMTFAQAVEYALRDETPLGDTPA